MNLPYKIICFFVPFCFLFGLAIGQAQTNSNCYDVNNAGKVGETGWTGCAGMYIVKDKAKLIEAKTEFLKLFNGKCELEASGEKKLVMSTNDIGSFPIAVKVHRIDFDGGQFVNTMQLSDRRNLL